jgi:thioredoxin-related protein
MLLTIVLIALIATTAFGVSSLANRRTPDSPSVPRAIMPYQLDRGDFDDPNGEWIFALFTSNTCDACELVISQVSKISLPNLVIQIIDFADNKALHQKYEIHSVPSLILADHQGVVQWSFAGVPPDIALSEALTNLKIIPPEHGQSVEIS